MTRRAIASRTSTAPNSTLLMTTGDERAVSIMDATNSSITKTNAQLPSLKCDSSARLIQDLRYTPTRRRVGVLQGLHKLIEILQPKSTYPLDFIYFHVTGYRPRGRTTDTLAEVNGRTLLADIPVIIDYLSRQYHLADNTWPADDPVMGVDDVAATLKVSTKTVKRWRNKGLAAMRLTGEDGKVRLAYRRSTVDFFAEKQSELTRRAGRFRRLSAAERASLVTQARELLETHPSYSCHQVARELAETSGRSVETVRYTLLRYDRQHPEQALFGQKENTDRQELAQRVKRLYDEGMSTAEIVEQVHKSSSTVHRLLLEARAAVFLGRTIDYIYSAEFDTPQAGQLILGTGTAGRNSAGVSSDTWSPTDWATVEADYQDGKGDAAAEDTNKPKPPRDLPAYLTKLYEYELLSAEAEQQLFRRYNYLKYLMQQRLEEAQSDRLTAEIVDDLERLDAGANEIKNRLIRCNLRLVVSIARKHIGGGMRNLFELISDGNMSLMRAVEKFDYTRGFKFSTYASWAIMKNFARSIPQQDRLTRREHATEQEVLEQVRDMSGEHAFEHILQRDQDRTVVHRMLAELDDREREVLRQHYGLGKQEAKTLAAIGESFGLTKERIRQIESKALTKLRAHFSPMQQ